MNESKQRMIQFEIQSKQLDIVHLQECQIDSDTFQCCEFISQNFQIIKNNADNGYGTACIIRNNIQIEKVKVIPGGRIISFNVGKTTFINMYLPSGTVGKSCSFGSLEGTNRVQGYAPEDMKKHPSSAPTQPAFSRLP